VAVIKKCDPQKVKQYLKEDYGRIRRRRKIESIFENVEIEKCGKLKFDLNSGYVKYGEVLTNFKPGGNEYKLLKALISNKNRRLEYEEINKILDQEDNKDRIEISDIIKNIKEKLNITGKNPVNENLFACHAGYMMNCDMDT